MEASSSSDGVLAPKAPQRDRHVQRERERKSRERRMTNLEQMRATLAALENALPAISSLSNDDNLLWETLLDPDTLRARRFLQQSIRLAHQAQQLVHARAELTRLLYEHSLATSAIEMLHAATVSTDDWDVSIRQWNKTTLRYFQPWTLEQCQVEMETALKELSAFMWSTDTQSSGISFLGWRDRRRIDPRRSALQFSFYKTFRGHDVREYLDAAWRTYTDPEVYGKVIVGHGKSWVHVLQKLASDVWIVRCMDRYPVMTIDVHTVNLVFRVKTVTGYTQCVRSLCVPELQTQVSKASDVWPSNTTWLQFDSLNDSGTDYTVHIGGSIASNDTQYTHRWLVEALTAVIRGERIATRRDLLTNL